MKKVYFYVLLGTMFLLASLIFLDIHASAETIKIGTLTESGVRFRSGPGTTYSVLGSLSKGDTGTILEEGTASNGDKWYQMLISEKEGWVHSDYVEVTEKNTTFEEYLTVQGFPASYRAQLLELHAKYPEWKFVARHTNLEWEDVITEESKLGVNLVHSNSISSWKSTQSGAYNWETGKWIGLDSSSWVAASTDIIQYYVDPRNFLDDTYIFQFMEQSYDANELGSKEKAQIKSGLEQMVAKTFLSGICENGRTYVDVIMEAAEKSGVSPYMLAVMIIQEQGNDGKGGCISGTEPGYEGYYNYFNIGAYETSSMTPVQRGLWFAKQSSGASEKYLRPWNTRISSICGGAIHFGAGYIKIGQDTLYLKKFNVQGSAPYTHQYMTNIQAAASEGAIMAKAYNKDMRKAELIFDIPVFENMPEEVCAKPTGDGSPNYMLKNLSVSGQSLTPTFSMYETNYSVIVPSSVSSVKVSATARDTNAKVSGTGTINLKVGTNVVNVKVKAANGTSRIYTISIVREAEETSDVKCVLTSNVYKVEDTANTITGIKTFPVSVADFRKNLTVDHGSIKVLQSDGKEATGNVGTGNQVKVYDTAGTLKATYDVILYGDTNGDGKVSSLDLLRVQKNIMKISLLKGNYSTSADTSRDGKISALDLLQIQKQILKISAIKQ